MMVREMVYLILVSAGGVGLGIVFFGGLWLTVRKGLGSKRPALWFFASFLVRTAIALAGVYLLSGGHWQRLLACLLGFSIARFIVTWLTRTECLGKPVPGAGHAA